MLLFNYCTQPFLNELHDVLALFRALPRMSGATFDSVIGDGGSAISADAAAVFEECCAAVNTTAAAGAAAFYASRVCVAARASRGLMVNSDATAMCVEMAHACSSS